MSLYLRRLELAGFKSFADRTRLEFEPGVSAIVGPNGSGKSNIAEAIRWVLGERAGKSLRAVSAENLIFAGMERVKAAASMAEVTLTLEGQGDQVAEKLIISRKLYRSGESEYRLNGRKALARDIAKLLAQSGFGTSSYTVIGQGMVEGLIIASPTERKLLFEEASGIRAFELERAATVIKLRQAEAQAGVLRQEANDLKPEHDRLAGQVERLARRRQTAQELQDLRAQFIYHETQQLQLERDRITQAIQDSQAKQKQCAQQARALAQREKTITAQHSKDQARQQQALDELETLQNRRNELSDKIADLQIRLGVLQAAQTDTVEAEESAAERKAKLEKRLTDLQHELERQTKASDSFVVKIDLHNEKIRGLTKELTKLRHALKTNQLSGHLSQAIGLVKLLMGQLNSNEPIDRERLRLVLHKLIRTVKLAYDADLSAAPEKIVKLQQQIGREMARREDVVEKQTAEIIKQRSLELDILTATRDLDRLHKRVVDARGGSDRQQLRELTKQLKVLTNQRAGLDADYEAVRRLIAQIGDTASATEQVALARQQAEVRQAQLQADRDLQTLTEQMSTLKMREQELLKQVRHWQINVDQHKGVSDAVDRDRILQLEAELTLIGEIDEGLAAVHAELADRIAYLEGQAQDMERAVADINKVLGELDRRIANTFEANFKKINSVFGREFETLFKGGEAKIELIAQSDEQFGIEISVRPPGKRLSALAALSGGEKTLAAIALLTAILQVNPSPFVVLDEVDAALDDHNATLFCETLRRLARHSQILVITHNHETMVHADRLYGVTSSPRRASTVVAVDLTTAEAIH